MRIDIANTPLIDMQSMTVKFDQNLILDSINFSISAGEIVTLVGPNGAGKSTFLRSIIGSVPITSGSIVVKPGLRIGYVPQRMHIDPTLPITVLRFLNLLRSVSLEECQEALTKAGIIKLLNQQMSDLSGGELQRVLLASALTSRPELLVLDEANQGLDHLGSVSFYQQIEEVCRELGCAILMVSHDLHVVMAASDRVLCLNSHICCEGSPEHVAQSPEYHSLFGKQSLGTMAIYRHDHDHDHDH